MAILLHYLMSILISCDPAVKVNPPPKPEVNITTLSWLSHVSKHEGITHFSSELQWKQKEQQWSVSKYFITTQKEKTGGFINNRWKNKLLIIAVKGFLLTSVPVGLPFLRISRSKLLHVNGNAWHS